MSNEPVKTILSPRTASVVMSILDVVNHGDFTETEYQAKTAAEVVQVLDEVFVSGHGYVPIVPRYSAGGVFAIINTEQDTIFTVMQTNDVNRFYIIRTNAQYKHIRSVSCEFIAKAMGAKLQRTCQPCR